MLFKSNLTFLRQNSLSVSLSYVIDLILRNIFFIANSTERFAKKSQHSTYKFVVFG